jgi:Spy/CpxP family protein refolding chaperone
MKRELKAVALAITFLFSCLAMAQDGPPPQPQGGGAPPEHGQIRQREGDGGVTIMRDGGERRRIERTVTVEEGRRPFPPGKWWKNSELVQKLGVSEPQVQQIEKIFQDTRLKLIDLHANLEKQEAVMEPLVESDRPDETKVLQQIDKVASARAELEKANAQMLLGIRRVLTGEQWKKLKSLPQPQGSIRLTGPDGTFVQGPIGTVIDVRPASKRPPGDDDDL